MPFNWNTIGSLILMCGGGFAIKLAGVGVITLETAIGIMAGGGAAVGGGTELANQVQSGEAINPGAIATRTAFGGVKGALWGLAPELGAVGFGASIGGYSAVENLTYNAAKGKTTASDSIEAIAGGLGEGIFAGIMHKASSKAASKASESVPAKSEPIRPMTEAELEKVSGGAKDPGWKPGPNGKTFWGRWEDYEKAYVDGQQYAKIGSRLYSRHAVDRMQPSGNLFGHSIVQAGGSYGRSVAPKYVEHVLENVKPILQENGNLKYICGTLEVVTNPKGAIVTIMTK